MANEPRSWREITSTLSLPTPPLFFAEVIFSYQSIIQFLPFEAMKVYEWHLAQDSILQTIILWIIPWSCGHNAGLSPHGFLICSQESNIIILYIVIKWTCMTLNKLYANRTNSEVWPVLSTWKLDTFIFERITSGYSDYISKTLLLGVTQELKWQMRKLP